jgi:hypothetical protein
MAYATKYVQNQGNCTEHWKGKPSGSSYKGDGCWLCAKGCAVLCILALKGLDTTEVNVKPYLNGSADVLWGKAGLKSTAKDDVSYPCIANVGGHFVIVKDSDGNVWDPNGGRKTKLSSYTVTAYWST